MSSRLTLSSGHAIDYQLSGPSTGFPLVWLHGTPGARTPIPSLLRACEKKGLRLITFSRAGYGESSRRKGRKIGDEPDVVQALLRELGLERCYVGGWSGGGKVHCFEGGLGVIVMLIFVLPDSGPHALACATKLKGCVAAVVVASVAPYDAEGLDWEAGQGQDSTTSYATLLR